MRLDAAHLWNAPQIVLDFLKTGDESLRAAARAAAWAAAWAAAGAAQKERFSQMVEDLFREAHR